MLCKTDSIIIVIVDNVLEDIKYLSPGGVATKHYAYMLNYK